MISTPPPSSVMSTPTFKRSSSSITEHLPPPVNSPQVPLALPTIPVTGFAVPQLPPLQTASSPSQIIRPQAINPVTLNIMNSPTFKIEHWNSSDHVFMVKASNGNALLSARQIQALPIDLLIKFLTQLNAYKNNTK